MKKIYFGFFIYFLTIITANAQLRYSFSASNGTFTPVTAGDTARIVADAATSTAHDDGYANSLPIGFTFNYDGVNYTTISANSNGFASFKQFAFITDTRTYDYYTADLTQGPYSQGNTRPVLAPLWDDLDLFSPRGITYKTTGIAPLRRFTLQWSNVYWDAGATSINITFQVNLFETTNVIEFHYKQEGGEVSSTATGSIGITDSLPGVGHFLSLSDASSNPTASSTVDTYTINTRPATGQIYRFTPAFTLPVTLQNFSGEKRAGSNFLSWTTQNEQNSKGFEIQRSADGSNFERIAFVTSKATGGNSTTASQYSFEDTKPLNRNSHYRLKQVDRDDKATYSTVVLLKGDKVTKLQLGSVYPNPAVTTLNMIIAAPGAGNVALLISDKSGKTVLQKNLQVREGDNNATLDVAKLAAGQYAIKAICNDGCETAVIQFVKQ